jgi:hydroxyacylglutathione hydrolase
MATIATFTFNGFQENTYVVSDETKACAIIDPGCYTREEQEALRSFIEGRELKPALLLNTHCHVDHVFGNAFVARTWGLALHAHRLDVPLLESSHMVARAYGLDMEPSPPVEVFLEAGTPVSFGNTELEVRFTPGHAPGHVVFYNPGEKFVIGGDVLFQGSIGRFDLPGGDYQMLMESIERELLSLPDDVTVHPGHGPATTIGAERKRNPFILEFMAER